METAGCPARVSRPLRIGLRPRPIEGDSLYIEWTVGAFRFPARKPLALSTMASFAASRPLQGDPNSPSGGSTTEGAADNGSALTPVRVVTGEFRIVLQGAVDVKRVANRVNVRAPQSFGERPCDEKRGVLWPQPKRARVASITSRLWPDRGPCRPPIATATRPSMVKRLNVSRLRMVALPSRSRQIVHSPSRWV